MKTLSQKTKRPIGLIVLIFVQALCAVFFVIDAAVDSVWQGPGKAIDLHMTVELAATIGLLLAIIYELNYFRTLLRSNARFEQSMRVASGALQDVIDEYFNEWQLTPSERDVALFTIKGLTIAEIAGVRNSREGTIKAHLNGIYRKASVTGRGQLVSLLVEDLIAEPLVPETP